MVKRFFTWMEDICGINNKCQALVTIVIVIIAAVGAGVLVFINLDRIPAATEDYAQLEQQLVAIQESSNPLFSTDYEVTIEDKTATIKLKNPECKLTVKFDQNLNVLDINYQDRSKTLWEAIGISIIFAELGGIAAFIVVRIGLEMLNFLAWLEKQISGKFRVSKADNDDKNYGK